MKLHLLNFTGVLFQSIENNWRMGRHVLQRINCRSENSKGVYCLQYDDQKIVSGLRDNTIKIWDRNTLQCTKVYLQIAVNVSRIIKFGIILFLVCTLDFHYKISLQLCRCLDVERCYGHIVPVRVFHVFLHFHVTFPSH